MSHFSTELRVLLEEHLLSQNALRRKTRISQSTLSRYLADLIQPSWQTVERIARIFPEKDRKRLITAHARDVVHPSLVAKIGKDEKRQAAPQYEWRDPRDRMPRELRAAYDGLGHAAIEHGHVAKLLINLWRTVGGK